MKNLKVLNLNSSKLQELQSGTFDELKLLESLDLSSNKLKTLKNSAITGLGTLRFLNLADNRLKVISFNLLDPLKVLKSFDLSNNDCINLSFLKVSSNEIKDQIIEECVAPVAIECFVPGPDYNEVEELREDKFDCKAVNLVILSKTNISKLKKTKSTLFLSPSLSSTSTSHFCHSNSARFSQIFMFSLSFDQN